MLPADSGNGTGLAATRRVEPRGPRPCKLLIAIRIQGCWRFASGEWMISAGGGGFVKLKRTIIRGGLETLYFSGMHHWLRPLVGGRGAILMLHHVRPARADAFQPNRLLEITPEFFEGLLRLLSRARIDVVTLDRSEAHT